MSEMVERVAKAIALRRAEIMLGADPATQTADERELARSAIEAMREPTEEMWKAEHPTWSLGRPMWDWWRQMIDAALE